MLLLTKQRERIMSKFKGWTGRDKAYNHLNERYTPRKYIEMARMVMGSINTDPASCEVANAIVNANIYYTQDDNGLWKSWYGNVWLNPPFTGNLSGWIYKAMNEYASGNVSQLILLYPAASGVLSTKWFRSLLEHPICIPYKRVCFWKEGERAEEHPPFSSLFSYFGNNEDKFIREFGKIGTIIRSVV